MLVLAVGVSLLAQVNAQESTLRTGVGGASIQLGTPIHTVDPIVSDKLRDKRVAAVVNATIKIDGSFDDLSAVGGDPDFRQPSLDAVRQWVYTPATLNGSPVQVRAFVMIGSNRGDVYNQIELDPTFPTHPQEPLEPKISSGEIFRVKPGEVTPPKGIYTPDPEYSEPARFAKYQGACELGLIIGKEGNPNDVWVVKKVGLGLDQKAIDAVRQWKFQPATKDGEPVAVWLNVEVEFHLY